MANWFVNHRGRVWQPLVIQLGQEIEEEEEQQERAALGQQGFAASSPLQSGAAAAAAAGAAGAQSAALGAEAMSAGYSSPLQRQHDRHGRVQDHHEQFGGSDVDGRAQHTPQRRLQREHLRGLEGGDTQPPWGAVGSASAGWQRPSVWGTAAPQLPLQFTPSVSPAAAAAEAASHWPANDRLQLIRPGAATAAAAQGLLRSSQPVAALARQGSWLQGRPNQQQTLPSQPGPWQPWRLGAGASAAARHPAAAMSGGFNAPPRQQPAAADTAPRWAAGLQPLKPRPAHAEHDLQASGSAGLCSHRCIALFSIACFCLCMQVHSLKPPMDVLSVSTTKNKNGIQLLHCIWCRFPCQHMVGQRFRHPHCAARIPPP